MLLGISGVHMIGKIFKKPLLPDFIIYTDEDGNEHVNENESENTLSKYANAVEWANNNGCIIEDCGDFYEVKKIPEKTIDQLKDRKLIEINMKYDEATAALVSTYPSTELLTFDKQELEATAWKEDNSIETPLIDMLVLGRGIEKADLVDRILKKAESFALATGYFTGLRQRYEDMLEVATTKEEVEAITPEYSLPEGGKCLKRCNITGIKYLYHGIRL